MAIPLGGFSIKTLVYLVNLRCLECIRITTVRIRITTVHGKSKMSRMHKNYIRITSLHGKSKMSRMHIIHKNYKSTW